MVARQHREGVLDGSSFTGGSIMKNHDEYMKSVSTCCLDFSAGRGVESITVVLQELLGSNGKVTEPPTKISKYGNVLVNFINCGKIHLWLTTEMKKTFGLCQLQFISRTIEAFLP